MHKVNIDFRKSSKASTSLGLWIFLIDRTEDEIEGTGYSGSIAKASSTDSTYTLCGTVQAISLGY